jgi:hypothetical protein
MEKRLTVMLLFVVVLSSLISAQLTTNEPKDIYHLGDKLFVTVNNIKGTSAGNLNVDLVCSNSTVNLLKISARAFSVEGGQSYSIPYKLLTKEDLEIEDLNSIVGDCKMRSNLGSEVIFTKDFVISNSINVNSNINKISFNPGEEFELSINAMRADGNPFNGFFRIGNLTDLEGSIEEGSITKNIKLDNDKPAGDYFASIEVYSLDENREITNYGSNEIYVMVNQVPTSVETALSDLEVVPGNELKINPSILDQSGENILGQIQVNLIDPDENKMTYNVVSAETLTITTLTNATRGEWMIYATANGLKSESTFTFLGVEKIDYTLENSVLTIKNIGNVDYFGIVKLDIGGVVQEIELKLDIAEEKEFVLEAPEGEYEINIDNGQDSYSATGFLTGNAIGVKEMGGGNLINFSFVWVILIFLMGGIGFVMMGMYRKTEVVSSKTSFGSKLKSLGSKAKLPGFKKRSSSSFVPIKKEKEEEDIIDLTTKDALKAESTLVMNGEKVNTSIVTVKIKDKDSYNENIQKDIVDLIKKNCGEKGVLDLKDDYIYLIFSPLITRSYKNNLLAVKIALSISRDLSAYNKKMSGDLNYGISVNQGDLISKKTGVKLRYTGVSNTIPFANKIAELSKNNVLVPESIRKGLIRDLKVLVVDEINKKKIYSVEEIKDREANKDKLNDLLKRMDK